MQKGGSCHLVFAKIVVIGHAFYFKASFHTDKILHESRRHLEFWSNNVFGHGIYFLVVRRTFVALF